MNATKTASLLLLLLLSLLLMGCGGADAPAAPTPTPDPLENPAVQALLSRLAAELSVEPEVFTIQNVRATEWPDTCLGMQVPNMACAEAITPGYIIEVELEGVLTIYHTNKDGSRIFLAFATE